MTGNYWLETKGHEKNIAFLESLANQDKKRIDKYLKTVKDPENIDKNKVKRRFWMVSDICWETNDDGAHVKIVTYRGIFSDAKEGQVEINFDAYSDGRLIAYKIPYSSQLSSRKNDKISVARRVYNEVIRSLESNS